MKNQKCKYCGGQPKVIVLNEIYYTQCSKCRLHKPYEFMGITKASSLRQWDAENIKRPSNKEASDEIRR